MSSAAGRKLRLGVLVSHPIQYFAPLFREMAGRPEIDLTVLYRTRVGVDAYFDRGFEETVQWDVCLLDGYRHEFLSNKISLHGFEPKIVRVLLRERFDVLLVHGYNSLTNLVAIAVGKLLGTNLLLRGDTRLQPHHMAAPAAKRWLKRWLLGFFDGFVAIGHQNRAYYLALGAPEDHLFFAPFSVANAAFALDPEEAAERREEIRKSLAIPVESVVVLYASKLTARKRPQDLLAAFGELSRKFPDVWLIMAGSGEQMPHLRALASELQLERVRFIGFQNQQRLPGLYAASDLFVLPSQDEPWGLVVNEVMAAGLPVIVSDEVGAVPDLVQGKGSGIVYPCGDNEALVEALSVFVGSLERRRQAGEKARQLIRDWDVDICATALVDAALAVTAERLTEVRTAPVGKDIGTYGPDN
jgi:glycosyltransferase involved in cell wall biosynthesis